MNCPRCGYDNPHGFAFCARCAAPLVWETPWAWPGPEPGDRQIGLVGRETEWAELQEAVRNLRAGRGGIVSIIGAAGLGKTRLAAELRRWAAQPDVDAPPLTWLTAAGRPPGDDDQPGFGVGARLLLDCLGSADESLTPTARLAQLVHTALPAEAEFVLHYLAHLVAVPGVDETPASERPVAAPGQHHVLRAFFRLLSALAQQAPLVLVVEDLHWVDESSARLLEHVWPLVRQQPVLFLLLYEPEEKHRCWDLRRQAATLYADSYRELYLHPLPDGEATRLLRSLPGSDHLSRRDQQAIVQAAQGNPLFLRELVQWRREIGLTAEPMPALPASLAHVLSARVDLLGREVRRVLEIAAVVGLVFPRQVLAQALILAGQDEGALQHIQRLQAAGLVQAHVVPGFSHRYAFTHYLIRQAVYEALSERTRAHLHLLVAQAIEAVAGSAAHDVSLAQHYARTDRVDQAIRYMGLAGDQALGRYADDEALACYQAGLRLAMAQPASLTEQQGLLRRIAIVQARRGQWADHIRIHERVLALQADDPIGQAETYQAIAQAHRCLGDRAAESYYIQKALTVLAGLRPDRPADAPPALRVALWLAQSSIAWASGDQAAAQAHAQQALELAGQVADETLMVLAWNQLGAAYLLAGEDHRAFEAFHQALAICQSAPVGLEARLRTCLNAGEAQAQIAGDLAAAQRLFEQALTEARRLGFDTGVIWAHLNLAGLACARGEWGEAEERLRQGADLDPGRHLAVFTLYEALLRGRLLLARGQAQAAYEQFRHAAGLAETLGDVVQGLIPARWGQALALWALGRLEPAALLLEQTLHQSQQEGAPADVAQSLFYLVRCRLAQGAGDKARQVYDRVAPALASSRRPRLQAQDLWLRGLLAAAEGQPQAAERDLRDSQHAWHRLGYRYEEAQVLLDLARFYLALGRQSEAMQHRDEARARFQLLGAAGDLAQAEALEGAA